MSPRAAKQQEQERWAKATVSDLAAPISSNALRCLLAVRVVAWAEPRVITTADFSAALGGTIGREAISAALTELVRGGYVVARARPGQVYAFELVAVPREMGDHEIARRFRRDKGQKSAQPISGNASAEVGSADLCKRLSRTQKSAQPNPEVGSDDLCVRDSRSLRGALDADLAASSDLQIPNSDGEGDLSMSPETPKTEMHEADGGEGDRSMSPDERVEHLIETLAGPKCSRDLFRGSGMVLLREIAADPEIDDSQWVQITSEMRDAIEQRDEIRYLSFVIGDPGLPAIVSAVKARATQQRRAEIAAREKRARAAEEAAAVATRAERCQAAKEAAKTAEAEARWSDAIAALEVAIDLSDRDPYNLEKRLEHCRLCATDPEALSAAKAKSAAEEAGRATEREREETIERLVGEQIAAIGRGDDAEAGRLGAEIKAARRPAKHEPTGAASESTEWPEEEITLEPPAWQDEVPLMDDAQIDAEYDAAEDDWESEPSEPLDAEDQRPAESTTSFMATLERMGLEVASP